MMPTLLLNYFVVLLAVLLLSMSEVGAYGIIMSVLGLLWVERELIAVRRLVEEE